MSFIGELELMRITPTRADGDPYWLATAMGLSAGGDTHVEAYNALREALSLYQRNRNMARLAKRTTVRLSRYFREQAGVFVRRIRERSLLEASPPQRSRIENIMSDWPEDSELPPAMLVYIGEAMQLGGAVARTLSANVTFSLSNPRATAYMAERGANLVTQINRTSRDRLRRVLTEAVDEGWSPGKVASRIRGLFADFSRNRAQMIARTELGNAYSEATLIVGNDLAGAGLEMQKRWLTVGPGRGVEEDCLANERAGWIAVNRAFPAGVMRPLQHPRCRCSLIMRMKP